MKQGGIRLAAVKQLTRPEEIVARIREIYVPNHFMSDYFQIDIDDIRCGKVTVSLLTDPIKHTNHREVLHGGVMMALADSVTGSYRGICRGGSRYSQPYDEFYP